MPATVDREHVLRLAELGAPIVDVLSPDEHHQLRIAGSAGLWLRELDAGSVAGFAKGDPIVVYCHDHL
ncbi:MAG: rhodanese-like domain-containing protein [Acidimicrobiia bacterium]